MTRLCFRNLKRAIKQGHDLRVYVGYSEESYKAMIDEYGFTGVYVSNDYLGRKKNHLLEVALQDDWHKLMELGSDNLLDLSRLKEYLSISSDHYGTSGIYFADPSQKKAMYYNAPGKIWGAGRVVSRQAVEKCVPLWADKSRIYLDAQANDALRAFSYSVVGAPICVDIKTKENLHPYSRFSGKSVAYRGIENTFPELKLMRMN